MKNKYHCANTVHDRRNWMSSNKAMVLLQLLVGCLLLGFLGRSQAAAQHVTDVRSRTSDAMQHVSPHGSDANDGLSWGSAKLTVFAACEALPGGATSPSTCGNGTIYFSDQSSATPVA